MLGVFDQRVFVSNFPNFCKNLIERENRKYVLRGQENERIPQENFSGSHGSQKTCNFKKSERF